MSKMQQPEFSAAQVVIESDIEETSDLLLKLGTEFRMNKHEYIFVGRSPTLLAALAYEYRERFPTLRSWILPISLVDGAGPNAFSIRQKFLEDLIKAYRPAEWPRDREWVFVDTVGEGTTMSQLELLVSSWLGQNRAKFAVLTSDQHKAEHLKDSHHLPAISKILLMSTRYENEIGRHKVFSAHDSVDLSDPALVTKRIVKQDERARFQFLRHAIRQKIRKGDL